MLTKKAKSSRAGVTPEIARNFASTAEAQVAQPAGILAATMDRRSFLKRSGLVAGGGAIAS